jgi:hypothetical protein
MPVDAINIQDPLGYETLESTNAKQISLDNINENTGSALSTLQNERFKIGNQTLVENKNMRGRLMCKLTAISCVWLFLTGIVVLLLGFEHAELFHIDLSYHLSDGVAIAFITTSLGTVLGLWAIGLRYFFSAG